MNWAQAEHWLKVVYPESLPCSWHEIIDLWLLERIATQPRWLRLFKFIDGLRQIPRLLRLLVRVWLMPGYFPYKIKEIWVG